MATREQALDAAREATRGDWRQVTPEGLAYAIVDSLHNVGLLRFDPPQAVLNITVKLTSSMDGAIARATLQRAGLEVTAVTEGVAPMT